MNQNKYGSPWSSSARRLTLLGAAAVFIIAGFALRANHRMPAYEGEGRAASDQVEVAPPSEGKPSSTTEIPWSRWQFSESFLLQQPDSTCVLSPEQGIVLGVDPQTCRTGIAGGAGRITIEPPVGGKRRVGMLRVKCPGSAGCGGAVFASEPGGGIAIEIDGQDLWATRCTVAGQCDSGALGRILSVAFLADASAHQVSLRVSPHTRWAVEAVEVDWLEMPSLLRGIAYSPFRDCQNPRWGPSPGEEQVREDLRLVRHMANAIRTYSSLGIQGQIPSLAREVGLRVSAGAWIGKDRASNENEIMGVIGLAKTVHLESVIVGNEVLLRGDLPENELIRYIEKVKAAVDVPVTTAEIAGILLDHPPVMDACDYLLVHAYGYWDGIPVEQAARHVASEYRRVVERADGKRVVIGETGWPSAGPKNGGAVTSPENQRRFLREFLTLARQERIELYYFSAFDELWKCEGGVGSHWGLLDAARKVKHDLQSVLIPLDDSPDPFRYRQPSLARTPEPVEVLAVYTDYCSDQNHFSPSGWMGDVDAVHFSDCVQLGQAWDDRSIEIRYTPDPDDDKGWAGLYWLEPPRNWAKEHRGLELSRYAQLRFRARSTVDGMQARFMVGGVIDGPHPSSVRRPIHAQGADDGGFVSLTEEWHEYHIDLRGANLSHVIDGFGWVGERKRTPNGMTVYLDDIIFDTAPPPLPPATAPAKALAAASGASDLFSVYSDFNAPDDHFAASGWMGDLGDIEMDLRCSEHTHSGPTAIRVSYAAAGRPRSVGCESAPCWWAGVYWQEGDWGKDEGAGFDLSEYDRLVFWARGQAGGERVEIGMGGIGRGSGSQGSTPYPDSARKISRRFKLDTEWRKYTIDLKNADLSHVIGGFFWAASRSTNKLGAVFFLDEIRFERSRICPE